MNYYTRSKLINNLIIRMASDLGNSDCDYGFFCDPEIDHYYMNQKQKPPKVTVYLPTINEDMTFMEESIDIVIMEKIEAETDAVKTGSLNKHVNDFIIFGISFIATIAVLSKIYH